MIEAKPIARGTVTFDMTEGVSWTTYGVFNHKGLVRVLTESEAMELARQNPEIGKALGLTPNTHSEQP